jgi:TP901 family phage tail tape measure protein
MNAREAALRLKLIDGVSGPAKAVAATLGMLNKAITGFTAQRMAANAAFMDASLQAVAFAAALTIPIRSAVKLEDALSDFNRVANLTDEELAAAKSSFLGLAREIPVAREELVAVAEAIVSAGAPIGELEERIRLITQASTAWGTENKQTAADLSAVGSALGLSLPQLREFADVVNYLANTRAAESPEIVDYVKRIGSLGKMAGLTKEQIAAIGTELLGMGTASDVAATATQAVLRALTKGTNATKGQRSAFKKLGLDAKQVAKSMQVDGDGTILDVLERLSKLSDDERLSVANELFGDEGRAMLALIEHRKRLAKTMEDAGDAAKTAGSVQKEYEGALKKTSAQLRILRNRLDNVSEAFGSALLPSIKDSSSALGGYLDKVEAVIRANPDFVRKATLTAAGMVAMRVAATGARAALFALLRPTNLLIAGLGYLAYANFDALKGAFTDLKALATDLAGTEFVKSFLAGAGDALKSIGDGAQSAIAGLRGMAAEGTKLRVWLDSVDGAGWGKKLGKVAVGLAAIGATAAALAAVAGPLRAIGRAVLLLSGIKPAMGLIAMLRGLGRSSTSLAATAGALEGINAAATKAASIRRPSIWSMVSAGALLADAASAIPDDKDALQDFIKKNYERSNQLNNWLQKNIGTPRSWLGMDTPAADPRAEANQANLRKKLEDSTADWPARAQRSIKSYGNALAQGGAEAEAEAAAIGARIEQELAVTGHPDVDTGRLEHALSIARQLAAAVRGVSTPTNTTLGNSTKFGGPRARGGPVKAGTAYLTGEIGPELFIPKRSGTIVSNKALGAAPSMVVPNINMQLHVHGSSAADLHRLAKEAAEKVVAETMRAVNRRSTRDQQIAFSPFWLRGDT